MTLPTPLFPPPPPPPAAGVNRVLGATSGAADGNVRAVLSLAAMLLLHALVGFLLVAYVRGSAADLKDFLLSAGTAIVTLDVACVTFYFGKRAGEQS